MANFNSDYLIDKMEEQEDMFRTKLTDVRQKNERLMLASRQLYECLLDRIGTSETTEQEREALDAFNNHDNA